MLQSPSLAGLGVHHAMGFRPLLVSWLLLSSAALSSVVLVTGRWVGCQAAPAGGAVSFRSIPSSLPLVGKLPRSAVISFLNHLGAPRAATLCLLEFTSSSRSSSNFSCSSTGRCFWFSMGPAALPLLQGWEQGMRGQSLRAALWAP